MKQVSLNEPLQIAPVLAKIGGMATFGDRIRQARMAAGISVNKMGQTIGVGRSNLISMEKGRRPIPPAVLEKIAQQLGLDLKTLLIWKIMDEIPEDIILAAGAEIERKRGER